jgi:hypothetical protein
VLEVAPPPLLVCIRVDSWSVLLARVEQGKPRINTNGHESRHKASLCVLFSNRSSPEENADQQDPPNPVNPVILSKGFSGTFKPEEP